MNGLLHVSSSPHARSKVTTDKIMFAVLLALAPAACVGVWNFGLRALLLIAISMAVCPLTEYLYEKGMKKPVTIADGSALVTGLLLAMNMPVQAPLWMPVIGGVFAILVVKQLFGGLGQNIMNPALAGRCFLLISFPGHMTNFAAPAAAHLVDTVSGATPLAAAKAGEQVNLLSDAYNPFPDTPLTVTGCTSDGASKLTVDCPSNGVVSIRAASDIGANYQQGGRHPCANATKTKEREVTGTISVSVMDKPDAPLLSAVSGDPQDGAVNLSWTAGFGQRQPDHRIQGDVGRRRVRRALVRAENLLSHRRVEERQDLLVQGAGQERGRLVQGFQRRRGHAGQAA